MAGTNKKHTKEAKLSALSSRTVWQRALGILSEKEKKQAVLVFAASVLAATFAALGVGSIMPFLAVLGNPDMIQDVDLLRRLYDWFGFQSSYTFLIALGIGSLVFIIISNLVQILNTYVSVKFTTMLQYSISVRLFSNYMNRPYEFFLDNHSGDMSSNILSESSYVVSMFFRQVTSLASALLTTVAMLVLVMVINPVVSILSILLIGGAYLLSYLSTRNFIEEQGRRRSVANSERHSVASDALVGIKDVKINGAESYFFTKFLEPAYRIAQGQIWLSLISEIPRYVIFTIAFGGVIILCLSFIEPTALESQNPVGGILPVLGVFALAAQRTLPEMQKIYHALSSLSFGVTAVERVASGLAVDARSGSFSTAKAVKKLPVRNSLQLENVSYAYPGSTGKGIKDISVTIAAGDRIGIVGSTGAGKTTLADIVLGVLIPTQGRILVDGTEITADNKREWLRSVGYVPQEIFVLDATIAENIAFGVPPEEIDMARVHTVAATAQLTQFVETEMPQGFETRVGERGVRLSGGQRQRLGIARALYNDADLIVFDEATSALDNLTENELISAINGLPGDKTILMIAHRLSTVRECDSILYLEANHLLAQGNWDDLVETCAPFRQVVKIGRAG